MRIPRFRDSAGSRLPSHQRAVARRPTFPLSWRDCGRPGAASRAAHTGTL